MKAFDLWNECSLCGFQNCRTSRMSLLGMQQRNSKINCVHVALQICINHRFIIGSNPNYVGYQGGGRQHWKISNEILKCRLLDDEHSILNSNFVKL